MISNSWWGNVPHPFPFVLAASTVTALVSANPNEGIQLQNVWNPLTAALLVTFIGWCLAGLLVRDRQRQALLAAIISLPLLTSGYIFGSFRLLDIPSQLRYSLEITCIIVVILAGTILIASKLPPGPEVSRFLNIFSVLFLLFTLPSVWHLNDEKPPLDTVASIRPLETPASRPDIYFIVVDEFTGTESLRRNYNYDNSSFLDSLRARGFVIPAEPRSNYMLTKLSVSSMLNRNYLRDVTARIPALFNHKIQHQLEVNRTLVDLAALGYELAYVGSSYPPLARNRLATVQYATTVSQDFERLWYWMTALPAAAAVRCAIFDCPVTIPFAETGRQTLDRLRFLKGLIARPGPKFVYAHWLLPHGPYRLTDDCEPREPRWSFGPNRILTDSVDRRLYLEQLQCTSRQLLEFVDAVRASSADEPVIILQADHGHGNLGSDPPRYREATPDQISERFDIFAAYAGPMALEDSLAAVRTPVNLFRTLFRVQWGFDEPPLPDRHFWSDPSRPFVLQRVELK